MSELLFEVYSEEIPASMQESASTEMLAIIVNSLQEVGVVADGGAFSTPRRVGFVISSLPNAVELPEEEIRGPKNNAPEAALLGFLGKYEITKANLQDRDGYFYYVKPASSIKMDDFLSEKLNILIKSYTWPKSMRWGEKAITWVRPIKSIIALFNNSVLPVKYGEYSSNNITYGHFFTGNNVLQVNSYSNYRSQLKEHNVIISRADRRSLIVSQIEQQARKLNIKMLDDDSLLSEIVGLVEMPYVHICEIDQEFMALPREVLTITLRHHQRYIMFENHDGKLAPFYAIVANTKGVESNITNGNQRVLRARLYDAKFFYDNDLKIPLSSRLEDLKRVVYHQQLGSVYDKVMRVKAVASKLSDLLNVDATEVLRATELCKCDLVSGMVKEFPELQGVMGSYYAQAQGETLDVAYSICDHYKPQGPSDSVPRNKVGAIVALADKIDSLNSLFGIGIKPTGSKDPFAQRRMALGVIRIIKEYAFNLDLSSLLQPEVLKFVNERLNNQ